MDAAEGIVVVDEISTPLPLLFKEERWEATAGTTRNSTNSELSLPLMTTLSAAGSELHKYPCPTVVQYQGSQKQTNQLLITIKHPIFILTWAWHQNEKENSLGLGLNKQAQSKVSPPAWVVAVSGSSTAPTCFKKS